MQGGEGVTSGRVEICQDLVWGLICMSFWDDNDATVVCRQLGFSDQGPCVEACGCVIVQNCSGIDPTYFISSMRRSCGTHFF